MLKLISDKAGSAKLVFFFTLLADNLPLLIFIYIYIFVQLLEQVDKS